MKTILSPKKILILATGFCLMAVTPAYSEAESTVAGTDTAAVADSEMVQGTCLQACTGQGRQAGLQKGRKGNKGNGSARCSQGGEFAKGRQSGKKGKFAKGRHGSRGNKGMRQGRQNGGGQNECILNSPEPEPSPGA